MNNTKAVLLVGTLLLVNLVSLCMAEGKATSSTPTHAKGLAIPCSASAPLLLAFALMAVHFLRAH